MQALGNFLIVAGLVIAAWQYGIIHGKEVATGKVTAIEAYRSGSGRGGPTYSLQAAFADSSGATHTYRAAFGLTSTGYQVGDRIRIYFDPKNPADCGVLSFGYRFGIGWGLFVAGLALWLFLGGWTVGNRWLESLVPTTVTAAQESDRGGATRGL